MTPPIQCERISGWCNFSQFLTFDRTSQRCHSIVTTLCHGVVAAHVRKHVRRVPLYMSLRRPMERWYVYCFITLQPKRTAFSAYGWLDKLFISYRCSCKTNCPMPKRTILIEVASITTYSMFPPVPLVTKWVIQSDPMSTSIQLIAADSSAHCSGHCVWQHTVVAEWVFSLQLAHVA